MLPRTRPAAVLILKSAYCPVKRPASVTQGRLRISRKCTGRVLQTSGRQDIVAGCSRDHTPTLGRRIRIKRVQGPLAVATSAFFHPAYKLLLAFTVLIVSASAHAQQTADYNALFRRCAANEVLALQHPQLFRFSERVEWEWGNETRYVFETAQGRADRIVAFRDEPLAADQQRKQYRRLKKVQDDPKAVREEIDEQRSEKDRRIKMARALADAGN